MSLHDFKKNLNHSAARFLALTLMFALIASEAVAASSATVVMYHRFGEESDYPSTSVSVAQFEAHIALLESGPYTVLPLQDIVAALKSGAALPDRTVAITIDDAYASTYKIAWPRLKKAGFPFTVFVATRSVDIGAARYMSWDQLREMSAAGVTIGHHTKSHLHMTKAPAAKIRAEFAAARRRYERELGLSPTLFAYPYGEMSVAARQLVVAAGFEGAFGQHSGVAHGADDRFFLPRFPFSERFGDLARFRRAADALPLPVTDVTPNDPLVVQNPPAFGFSVDAALGGLDRLACFHSQFGKVRLTRLGAHRVEIRFDAPFKRGRSRLNCTMPAPDRRWRWYGRQFYVNGR